MLLKKAEHVCFITDNTKKQGLNKEVLIFTKLYLVSFDDIFQFPKQFWFYVRTQVDDRSCQAVVLKRRNGSNV